MKTTPSQPTGMTDIESDIFYLRGTGERIYPDTMGFRGIRTTDGRAISWKDLFYKKEDALLSPSTEQPLK